MREVLGAFGVERVGGEPAHVGAKGIGDAERLRRGRGGGPVIALGLGDARPVTLGEGA